MIIRPQRNNLYVRLEPVGEKKVGSIFVPGKHVELSRIATVLAIGNEVEKEGLYKVGDKVLVNWTAGVVLDLIEEAMEADCHRIIADNECLALIED